MLVLIPLAVVALIALGSLVAGIAKDGTPFARDFWTA